MMASVVVPSCFIQGLQLRTISPHKVHDAVYRQRHGAFHADSQLHLTRMRDTSLFPVYNPPSRHMALTFCLKPVVMNTYSVDGG